MGVPAAVREHAVFAEVVRELAATARMAADAALLSGGSEQVLPSLRQALERTPLDESLQAALVMALAASGLQAEALAAYDRVRRLLAEELGVAPGAELVAAHGRVLRQEWGPTRSRATTGPDRPPLRPPAPPAPPGPSPRTPAADPSAAQAATTATTAAAATTAADRPPLASPVFVGRRAELGRLAEITDAAATATGTAPGTPASVLISGMPGIGKTALALHWAAQVAGRFPDGRLDVGLRGSGPEGAPLDPAAALRALLTALGVPAARMPDRTDSLAGLYRSLLAGRRLLLVLDDAADTEQVRPLLPASPGCLTLVTSRHGLTGLIASGTHPLRLDLPSAADARAMLASHTGPARPAAEPAAADEIVTRCGRLPLALAFAAARAAARPDIPLTALANELRRTRATLDAFAAPSRGSGASTDPAGHGREPGTHPGAPPDLRTVFARSYGRLPPESARLFRLLARHPGPGLTPDAAAALAGLPARRARLLLDGLADAHLVTERAPGRYTQHELLRVFAAELGAAHGHGGGPQTP
jgi:hypothetical protein